MATAPGPSLARVASKVPQLRRDRLGFMEWLHRDYGDVVRIPFGPRVSYGLFAPEHFAQVLVTNHKNHWKGRTFAKTAAYLGNGLATSEGKFWQSQRRKMNPHFSREALGSISEVMVQNIGTMLDRWSEFAKHETEFDASFEFQRLVMNVVARSLFGNQVPEADISAVIEGIREALAFTNQRIMIPFDIPESWPLPSNRRYRRAIDKLDALVARFIRDERGREEPSHTLLSMLVSAQDPETGEYMSDQQIRDEVMTIFLGGTDTSGNTLGWVLTYLQRHPEVQARAREEVARVLSGRAPRAEDFMALPFVRRTIEETLRLSPQNWVMSRDSLADQTIAGFEIPKGATIFLGVYVAHRRPDIWENPEGFDPDRFAPEKASARHLLAHLPFGAGARKCVGFHFAMMEITFAITMILQRFEIQVTNADSIVPSPTWSLWPSPGVMTRLHEK